ncbi:MULTISPECIES: 3-phosphoserine/phosphohydroxythreonine transaminase [Priestia]|uniref:Phosphoserine aminotransferase n=1 Tax=Priestia megaterium (strain WSH-002) TaxID=1006007 RepID=A0A8D3X5P5_PRIMW|nr:MULTISPECIES: 3-phosphoserine/phosphohydroxythreonine transaminase [Priestia]AEN91529.1 Phosphoserine aminotransferase [Priestia megaterium WSH-002]QDZ82182.1 3-phosphoserine/phosphohydroxythreonine transaminase [Priestia megaterium]TPF14494.1 3-phosphoserine/phosphohydroxythreonine aminotransferase [Priestia megaterium]TPF19846.1 3-phosphoserine/phosphohydroxythreonine aminotransferase [Priestia megaterium]SUV00681.1 phosphoserine aminotransferase [Priestia megaterium]
MITLNRAYNFNAGPSALPLPVLQLAQEELVNFKNTGMSVMELSHRSKEFEDVLTHAKETLTELLNIPDTHEILFLQGGASLQFSMIPMNFLAPDQVGAYVLTGSWSEKALKEAKKLGKTAVVASTKEENYRSIPALDDVKLPKEEIGYLHITSNNTIFGTQWADYPSIEGVDLIADMSSDILCRQIDVSKFSLIYAGAQKNLGPSGVTVVILKKELLKRIPEGLPTMLNYETHVKSNSLYNTPPTFGIYMLSLVLDWIKEQGGVKAIEAQNHKKAKLLYSSMERSSGFYTPHATEESRSIMNVTFTLPNDELTAAFLQQAKEKGFVGLAGHRSIGGCRASIYNAVPIEACEALAVFMDEFAQANA